MCKNKLLWILPLLALLISACRPAKVNPATLLLSAPTPEITTRGMMRGMGPGSGMMARHHAAIPSDYAGLSNPAPADKDSLSEGEELFTLYCANCHGDGGMGDGPIAENLDPAPAGIAHTSQMLGDDYLFWRISEGGHEFESAMPAWAQALTETQRWHVINYVRALGSGTVVPGNMMGGATFDPAAEAAQRAHMLTKAVDLAVISPAEAESFDVVHAQLDQISAAERGMGMNMVGNADEFLQSRLAALVADGLINQAEADSFIDVHDRLLEAGLMQ